MQGLQDGSASKSACYAIPGSHDEGAEVTAILHFILSAVCYRHLHSLTVIYTVTRSHTHAYTNNK